MENTSNQWSPFQADRRELHLSNPDFTAGRYPVSSGSRRRRRMVRFVAYEGAALLIMISSIVVGISTRFAIPALTPVLQIVPIGAAVLAGLIPIIFFARSTDGPFKRQ